MTEAYYFRQLDKAGQAAYHAMKTGLAALRPAFPVPRLEGRELGDVLARLRLDCPELFYVTGFSYRVHPAAATVELLPQYFFADAIVDTPSKDNIIASARIHTTALLINLFRIIIPPLFLQFKNPASSALCRTPQDSL